MQGHVTIYTKHSAVRDTHGCIARGMPLTGGQLHSPESPDLNLFENIWEFFHNEYKPRGLKFEDWDEFLNTCCLYMLHQSYAPV